MTRYRLSRAAGADLVELYLFGVELFGAAQAERYAAGVETCFAMLADNPQLAREREELRQRPRAFRYKAHLIFSTPKPTAFSSFASDMAGKTG